MALHPHFPAHPYVPLLPAYRFVYVDQESFEKHAPHDFGGLVAAFTDFQEQA